MTTEQLQQIISVVKSEGSMEIGASQFLEFLPTEEEQLLLAAERIIVKIENSFQTILFKEVKQTVLKQYYIAVMRAEYKTKVFSVSAENTNEANHMAMELARNYNYGNLMVDNAEYEIV